MLAEPAYFDVDEERSAPESKDYRAGRAAFDKASAAHAQYLVNGAMTDALLQGVIALAKLDFVFRTGGRYIDENFGRAFPFDVKDLRTLISAVNPRLFRSKQYCILNPTFGEASRWLAGGADADVIIDGTLIDIKAIKTLRVDRDHFTQLLGYVALAEINRQRGASGAPRITKIGIYFARHAHLEVWDLKSIINPESFASFLRWFSKTAGTRGAPVRARRPQRRARASTRRRITA
jgi:hypothetical protein